MQSLRYEAKVETTSPIRRQLTISVAPESIKDYIESSYAKLQKSATLKGFRKGKVPLSLLKKYYSGDVKSDVLQRVVSESFWKAVQDHKIPAVGNPEIENLAGTDFDKEEPFSFTAQVDVFPEVKIGNLKGVKVTKQDATVTDADLQKSLDNMLESKATIQSLEGSAEAETPAKEGDYVEISFKGEVEGKTDPSLQGAHQVLKIGSKKFLEEFEAGIVGMKKGEVKDVTVNFGQDFPDEMVAGKPVKFEITLHEKKQALLPALDDEFASQYKASSVDDLKQKVRDSLEKDRQRQSQENIKEQLIRGLLESHPFDVPKSLVDTELQYMIKEVAQHLERQGFTEKMTKTELGRSLPNMTKQAQDRVRAFLIFDRIAEEQKLQATDADLDQEFETMAKNMGLEAAQVKGFYQQSEDALRRLRHRIKEDRVVEYLLKQVSVS